MLINITYNGKNYFVSGKVYNLENIMDKIKAGNEIRVLNEYDVDITKEVLAEIALRDYFLNRKNYILLEFIANYVEEEVLYQIIHCSNLQIFMDRVAQGFYKRGEN